MTKMMAEVDLIEFTKLVIEEVMQDALWYKMYRDDRPPSDQDFIDVAVSCWQKLGAES